MTDEPFGEAGTPGSLSEKLVISPSMQIEQSDPQTVTIYLRSAGTRLRIPRALYELLLKFEIPQSLASIAGSNLRVASAIERLRDKGFLLGEGDAEQSPHRLVTDPPVRLFDCPAHKLAPSATDLVVVGIPYDLSDRAAAGARQGPSALRETSLQLLYGIDRRTGQPHGWFDADLARPILRGVTIGDCGDVFVDPGERQAQLFARIAAILGKVTGGGSLPVLLGGDAAIGFPAIELLQARLPLAVIRIGGAAPHIAAPHASFVSPSTLPARVLALPGVRRYVHVGAGERPGGIQSGLATVTAPRFRREGMAALEQCLDDGMRVYVGLDLDALVAPGDADGPESAHFAYAELHALLCGIGERYTIAGFDLVGANPLRPGWGATAMTAVHLLLTGLSAAKDRRGAEARS
ncbi:arginase family protein [Sphingomonas gei]|uniref:arginase family protein n=1 Tax=Sphingomonas gei TaxID=1395960 RepID=UPI0019D27E5F|nr:arginase family protein [Sphingomonas gei]